MNIEEIKAQILSAIQNKINDDTLPIIEKWDFIELSQRLLGHYECEEFNKTPHPSGCVRYNGTPEEFVSLKRFVLNIE